MTEPEWLACDDPEPMLDFLGEGSSPRKLRLFAVACCRRAWGQLGPESRQAVDIAERYADGAATDEEVLAMADVLHWGAPERPIDAACYAVNAAFDKGYQHAGMAVKFPYNIFAANCCAVEAREDFAATSRLSREEIDAEARHQCAILRDIFGNPFRPVALDPAWLTPTVRALAQAAYDERALPAGELDVQRLAILADALEDAGCQEAHVLEHCRGSPRPHVRGFWVVDWILGKS
jgi:hypothetical protein